MAFGSFWRSSPGKRCEDCQADVNWDDLNSLPDLVLLNTFLPEQNKQLGIIYNGTGTDVGVTAWLNHAVLNFETVEGYLEILPDRAIFMSWDKFPQQLLPETTPNTMTWLINRYALERSRLEAQFVGQGAQGKLTTSSRKTDRQRDGQGALIQRGTLATAARKDDTGCRSGDRGVSADRRQGQCGMQLRRLE